MKRLILLRHAKSSWVNPDLGDFERPLNKRGQRSAKALGKWLRQTEWLPDHVLCSTARRTRETFERLHIDSSPELLEDLYHASAARMLETIRTAEAETLMVIGHNPGTAQLAHSLVAVAPDHPRFADYPTGALLVAEFDIGKWSKLASGSGRVLHFLTPHDLAESKG
ncbi:histidine phosphatase family protein [Tropicimonas sp. TH_r6]|uniref:SixA phosphatase family protein n=1 Tax=Tropicimonas sp. TH_r6 TaxID=3082085 RepID=UPI0029548DE6|nr:histidine phosphatase family protein [Tropicimonas sp. TH_r6]MDV7142583.1 histidine phosphatase family protein [Tropicimonas sp. TH_r6]